nr:hypothetical protein [Sphingomonas sp. H160509]
MDLYVMSFWAILIVLSVLAWRGRGRALGIVGYLRQPELAVAALCWTAALATVVLGSSSATRFYSLERSLLVIDCGLLAGLAIIGVRSGKGWVLCAAALHLLSTTAHVARLTTPGMWRLGYQVMEEASSYPVLLLLALGIWSRHRAVRSAGRSRNSSKDPRQKY